MPPRREYREKNRLNLHAQGCCDEGAKLPNALGAFRREQCPGTKEEATSLSSTSASMCASTV